MPYLVKSIFAMSLVINLLLVAISVKSINAMMSGNTARNKHKCILLR